MRIRAIELDADEPTSVTVEMTAREAALVARMIGATSPADRLKYQADGGEVGSGIYDALAGGVFNRFYDDGLGDFPR